MNHSWPVGGTPPPDKPRGERCPKCGRYYSHAECPFCKSARARSHVAPASLLILGARIVVFTVLVIAPVIAANVIALWFLNLVTDVNTLLALLLCESVVLMFLAYSGAWQRAPRGDGLLSRTDFWISVGVAGVILLLLAVYLASQYY